MSKLEEVKINIDNALLDDFDTPRCIQYLLEFIKDINKFLENKISYIVLNSCCFYITKMLKVFGLINDNNIGFPLNDNTNVNKEKIIEPFIESIINFRNKVRKISKDIQLLKESDILRDEILPNFGVKLEDKDGDTIWKFDNPENIKLQIAQKNTKNEEKEK